MQKLATGNSLQKLHKEHISTFQHEVQEILNEWSTTVNNNNTQVQTD
jgi:hypothetical protein